MTSPEVIDALSNQLVDPVAVLGADEVLHFQQLHFQLSDPRVPDVRHDPALQDLLRRVLDVFQVPFNLAHCIVPQLEARVTLDTAGEVAGEAASAFVAAFARCALPALARPRQPVALGHLRAQRVAVTL